MTDDIIITLFRVMQYHEDCSDVQCAGISFLLELAKNDDSRQCLINNDIDDVILQAQAKHPKRDVIQKMGMELFQLLCELLLSFYTQNESMLFAFAGQHIMYLIVASSVYCK